MEVTPEEVTLALGEPALLTATIIYFAHPDSPSYSEVTWTTDDPSVAVITETGIDDEWNSHSWRRTTAARIRGLSTGTTDAVATSSFDSRVRGLATITVADDLRIGSMDLLEGRRVATVGDTLTIEIDVSVYGAHEPEDGSVSWELDDPQIAVIESTESRAVEPHLYRNTAVLRSTNIGVTPVRAVSTARADLDVEIAVTVAPDLDTTFVVIRNGDRMVDAGDTFCVTAYVGMPVDEPSYVDAWLWWWTDTDVLEPIPPFSGEHPTRYPYDSTTCWLAVGPGITQIVAQSARWPDASASVTIEVRE